MFSIFNKKQKKQIIACPTYEKVVERHGHTFKFIIEVGSCKLRHGLIYDYYTMFVDGVQNGCHTYGGGKTPEECIESRIKSWVWLNIEIPSKRKENTKWTESKLVQLGAVKLS